MKTFKPFDKVLYRINKRQPWTPSFYQYEACFSHFVMGISSHITDKNILPYESNEHFIGTCNEPEEEIILKKGELIICSDSILCLSEGLGVINDYKEIVGHSITSRNGVGYSYCVPMSKYDPDNLEETSKWILTVKNDKLVKVNK